MLLVFQAERRVTDVRGAVVAFSATRDKSSEAEATFICFSFEMRSTFVTLKRASFWQRLLKMSSVKRQVIFDFFMFKVSLEEILQVTRMY
jgi:hypothetical protein